MIYDICTRCHRPITSDNQTCGVGDLHGITGLRFPCVPRSDKTVIRVDDLLIKTGNDANPVPILEDYYE